MKIFFLVCYSLLSFVSDPAWAAGGGSIVGNGGGLAEQNFTYAYTNLAHFYDLCWAHENECLSTAEEKKIFHLIRDNLSQEYKTTHQIQFLSGQKNPSLFAIDGQIRTAVTGDHVGDPIFINLDLIYQTNSRGEVIATDLGTALAILTHELGHHHQVKDHQFLDLLGAKIHIFSMSKGETLKYDHFSDSLFEISPDLTIFATHSDINPGDTDFHGPQSWLVLNDGQQIYDLNTSLNHLLYCPSANGQKDQTLGYRLYQLQWNPTFSEKKDLHGQIQREYKFQSSIYMICQSTSDNYPTNEYQIILHFTFQQVTTSQNWVWTLAPDLTQLEIIPKIRDAKKNMFTDFYKK